MKINDAYCQSLELWHTQWELQCAAMEAADTDPWDGFLLPPDETVVARPRIGTEPLPVPEEANCEDEDGTDDDDGPPTFESIEEAGKCLARFRRGKWTW
jgi:hypothetical protein